MERTDAYPIPEPDPHPVDLTPRPPHGPVTTHLPARPSPDGAPVQDPEPTRPPTDPEWPGGTVVRGVD